MVGFHARRQKSRHVTRRIVQLIALAVGRLGALARSVVAVVSKRGITQLLRSRSMVVQSVLKLRVKIAATTSVPLIATANGPIGAHAPKHVVEVNGREITQQQLYRHLVVFRVLIQK
jgi:hypothetical protein